MKSFAAIALAALLVACGGDGSDRCRMACDKADECADKVGDPNYKFDKGECEAACAFLEKDRRGTELVATYVECVKAAKSCSDINACE